jgi:NADH:ubiquinone oxidoreductase subunit 5 (subunit L)/multisubunit Na+/H+ antiporter MnhA subunit
VASGAIGISLLMSIIALVIWAGAPLDTRPGLEESARQSAWLWAYLGPIPIHFGVKLDSLTIIMYLMVALCATCIHVFSIGYMAGDPRFSRFFAFLSLFCFSMLGLVISSNLLFLFIFWELVGVCSYLLIGFWFEKKSASNAAIKAFVINRVGDFGFMVGLGLCVIYLNTLSLDTAAAHFESGARHAGWVAGEPSAAAARVMSADAQRAGALFTTPVLGVTLATWLGIGLFCGAIGKSAQFPLQVWLPDAMEGPTPVSALIHAATMVAAGVYLTARIFTLLTPGALTFITVIGCITLGIAALMAIVQTDIKRVLAYSTLSQLGYMIFGLGVGAWIAALFHLLTHAFFKALLFLGAGQVIAGAHHEQDLRRFGGLWSRMPRTAWTFLIAVLAISGAGIPWTPIGLGGFYSKDEILAVTYFRAFEWKAHPGQGGPAERSVVPSFGRQPAFASAAGASSAALPRNDAGRALAPFVQEDAGHAPPAGHAPGAHAAHQATDLAARYPRVSALAWWLFMVPLAVAYITPFYMGRCFVLTFMGRPRDPHVHEHAHETRLMYGPLLVLAGMTIVSGCLPLFRSFVAYAAPGAAALSPAIDAHHGVPHGVHDVLPLMVGFAWVLGLGGAYLLYRDGLATAERLRQLPLLRQAHAVLTDKFYFDHLYGALFVGGAKVFAVACRLFDAWIIDGIVHALAYLTERIARFSGVALDNGGVDGVVNGVARLCWVLGGALRQAQTGVIRNYVLLAALAAVALLLSCWSVPLGVAAAALGVSVVARNITLLIVLAVATAIFAGWQREPAAAIVVLSGAVAALMLLGHQRDAEEDAAEPAA